MATHITTSDDASSAQPLTEDEKRAIFLACERALSGHGPHRPAETLAALAHEAADTPEPDHYGEGAVIEDFEREIASLLGKEAAVFMPSGTMAQQIALRIWSERKNCYDRRLPPALPPGGGRGEGVPVLCTTCAHGSSARQSNC